MINEKRSINKINDSTVTLNTLREVAHRLFDLHGQQEHQTLLKERNHLSMLDHFLSEKARKERENCRKLLKKYAEISREIDALVLDDQQRLREIGFLEHEIQEIETAHLVVGEDEKLEQMYQKMVHSKEIAASCDAAARLTGYEEDTAIGNQLTESIRRIQEVSHLDSEIMGLYEQLLQVEDLLGSFHQEITDYVEDMEFDEQAYIETEERLNIINGLKDKYGSSIETVLKYGEDSAKRLEILQNAEDKIKELKEERKQVEDSYKISAGKLSAERKKIAKKLQRDITRALEDLNFLSVVFEIQITEEEQMSPDGINKICFMISMNPGLPPRPIQEVASGGELSRIMLAMKSVLAEVDQVETLILMKLIRESAVKLPIVWQKMMEVISRQHQVIAITHLPQIAATADSHYCIEKQTDQKKTTTIIRELDSQESLEEIARMINGNERTEIALKNAKEMKTLANGAKLY